MAQDVVINGTTYPAVEAVALADGKGNTTMFYPDAVRYVEQTLTEEQQAQARKNLGVVGTVTPWDYGAKGDGSADDTTAFQNALNNNRIVYVPSGTYKLSGELVVGNNCQLELAQDVLLNFTQTSGNCISMRASANIKGNHSVIKVPYEFTGRVINIYAGLDESIVGVPPMTAWGPMWMAARYITDLHIVKLDYRGVAQSVDGNCSGTAVYLGASVKDSMNFLWAVDLTRLRISGAFTYGIHMDTVTNNTSGWIHQTRISAFVDGAEVGVYAKDSALSHLSVMVIPRRALTTAGEYVPYAKWGIYLENCSNVDLSGSRVMDWNSTYSLWSEGSEYQHLALMGDCSGAILNEHYYYASSNYDIRSLIHTDRQSNLERLTILQEPFTRWFKPIDNVPYFNDGNTEKKIALQDDLDRIVAGENIANFTNALPAAIDTDGSVFNGIGYATHHARLESDGSVNTTSAYHGCTGFIPVKQFDVIYGENITLNTDGNTMVVIYDASFNYIMHATGTSITSMTYFFDYEKSEDGFKLTVKQRSTVAYVRFGFLRTGVGTKPAISVNEPISYSTVGYLQDGIKVNSKNVVGGDAGGGASTWEDLGSTFEEGVVLAECSPAFVTDFNPPLFAITEAFPLVEGKEYTVNWNGMSFTCICTQMAMGIMTGLGLGNIGMLTGGENTGEPFVLGVFSNPPEGIPAAAVPLDGSTTLTISITGPVEIVTPVPEKYIPKLKDYVIDLNESDGVEGLDTYQFDILLDTTELYETLKNHGSVLLRITLDNGYVWYVQATSYMMMTYEGYIEDIESRAEDAGGTLDLSALPLTVAGYDAYNDNRFYVRINLTD